MKKSEKIIESVNSEVEKALLLQMRYHDSFVKTKKHLYNLYALRLSVSEEVTHVEIDGLRELLTTISNLQDDDRISVNIFLGQDGKNWAVFTDVENDRFYGIVKGGK